ncbi:type II secretion system GspH family protein [Geomonas sp. RF6]|uniref:type II secretion system protein n=1 Tax=Geomonas sp. RF6 TaxID=2897342 RepID=UPI001E2A20E6|nr:type II secretion system protein [Geomonas sp. RF6]UFS72597.1 type II secretion system GspH family protein [Geomonas sp. RF6]
MTRTVLGERGFTYIGAMVAVILMGIALGVAGTYWSTRMQRDRETELIFRGIQYRDAIRGWYGYVWDDKSKSFKNDPAARTRLGLPAEAPPLTDLEQLVKDPNSSGKVRWLRRLYPDPVLSFQTGKPEKWDVVKDANQRIIGVKSRSEARPLKQGTFPDDPISGLEPADFEGKEKYSDWQFIYNRVPKLQGSGKQSGEGVTPTPGGGSSTGWKGFSHPE